MRLERSDGHAELVALLRVLDAQLERGAGEADQRAGGEHAPFVDRALVQRDARRHRVASTVRSPMRNERSASARVAEVVHRLRARRLGLDDDQLVGVEPGDDGRDRARGHEPGDPVVRRVQATRGDGRRLAGEPRRATARAGASPPRRAAARSPTPRPAGWAPSAAPKRSATSSRSSSAAPPPPSVGSAPIVGPPSAPNASQSSGSNPPRLLGRPHDRRRALLGEERAERLDQLVLLVAEREVHR